MAYCPALFAERARACRGRCGWGRGAGSLTPNSLLGDSSSQSLDTSHGNHGPEMPDSLRRAGSRAAGARVSPRPGRRLPAACEAFPPWVPQPREASLTLSPARRGVGAQCPAPAAAGPSPGGRPGRGASAEAASERAARTWGGGVSGGRGPRWGRSQGAGRAAGAGARRSAAAGAGPRHPGGGARCRAPAPRPPPPPRAARRP